MARVSPSPSTAISTARKAASSTSIPTRSTGVTSTVRPSGSRRRIVEKSLTRAGRVIGLPL